jgi:hypothetical protein
MLLLRTEGAAAEPRGRRSECILICDHVHHINPRAQALPLAAMTQDIAPAL